MNRRERQTQHGLWAPGRLRFDSEGVRSLEDVSH